MRSLVKLACLATTLLFANAQVTQVADGGNLNVTVAGIKSANVTARPHILNTTVSALVNT